MFKLRRYQNKAIEELFAWFEQGNSGNPLMVLPTGAGKSVILAKMIEMILTAWPDQRISMLTHSMELISQNFEKLVTAWPEAPAGIYSASVGRRDAQAQVLYAGIQSVYDKTGEIGFTDLIFIDEAHLVNNEDSGMYRQFLRDQLELNPNLRVVGLTATEFRLKNGYLWDGDDALFDAVATKVEVKYLIDNGYLCRLVSRPTHTMLDTSELKKRGGEYTASSVQAAIEEQDLLERALANAWDHAFDRNSWIVFCPTIDIAEEATAWLNDHGIKAATISQRTPKKKREEYLEAFKRGELQALTNVNVLTTGFDAPRVDCLVLLRPTLSTGLYLQMMGRGMRLFEGKENCLVLDYAGNIERHGCVDEPILNLPGKRKGEPEAPPYRICDACEAYCSASAKRCDACGYVFPVIETQKFGDEHSTQALLSDDIKPDRHDVGSWRLSLHKKAGNPNSLKVEYFLPGNLAFHIATEWVSVERSGKAKVRANSWWKFHDGEMPPPDKVEEAIRRQYELSMPDVIWTIKKGKYRNIVDRAHLVEGMEV